MPGETDWMRIRKMIERRKGGFSLGDLYKQAETELNINNPTLVFLVVDELFKEGAIVV